MRRRLPRRARRQAYAQARLCFERPCHRDGGAGSRIPPLLEQADMIHADGSPSSSLRNAHQYAGAGAQRDHGFHFRCRRQAEQHGLKILPSRRDRRDQRALRRKPAPGLSRAVEIAGRRNGYFSPGEEARDLRRDQPFRRRRLVGRPRRAAGIRILPAQQGQAQGRLGRDLRRLLQFRGRRLCPGARLDAEVLARMAATGCGASPSGCSGAIW